MQFKQLTLLAIAIASLSLLAAAAPEPIDNSVYTFGETGFIRVDDMHCIC